MTFDLDIWHTGSSYIQIKFECQV